MEKTREINLLDFIAILVKWKKFIIITVIISMIISYAGIYFFVDEQFEASALIVPSEDESMGGVAGLMKGLKGLPLDITGTMKNTELSLYNTIIYSRSSLEEIIDKFNLIEIYEVNTSKKEYREEAIKILKNSIEAGETKNNAYEIVVTAPEPILAASITNYIIDLLNRRIIELKIKKSKNNREFLELRLDEVKNNLKDSEDSLRIYQERSGILDAKEQVKGLIGAYSTLETTLITKQIEQSILENILDKNSPQLRNVQIQVGEFKDKLEKIKREGQPDGIMLSLDRLPKKAMDYLRLYRSVEINSTLLEFILPLYEQSRYEEQRDTPVLQVVDSAIPPAKKSFPPRTIFTLLIGFGTFLLTFFYVLIKENPNIENSEKLQFIKKNLFRWKNTQ